jgi:hypothetical protein
MELEYMPIWFRGKQHGRGRGNCGGRFFFDNGSAQDEELKDTGTSPRKPADIYMVEKDKGPRKRLALNGTQDVLMSNQNVLAITDGLHDV